MGDASSFVMRRRWYGRDHRTSLLSLARGPHEAPKRLAFDLGVQIPMTAVDKSTGAR